MRVLVRLGPSPALVIALALAACVGSPPPEVIPALPADRDSSAPSLPPPERAVFVIRRGGDTLFVERFSRTRDLLSGDIDARGQGSIEYQASLDHPAETVSRIVAGIVPAGTPAGTATRRATANFRGDSVIVENVVGDSTRTDRYATRAGAIPYINPSMALAEQMVRRARVVGGTQVELPVFVAGTGGQTVTASVTFAGADSAQVNLAGTTLRFAVDREGRLLGGLVPEQGLTVSRTTDLPAKP